MKKFESYRQFAAEYIKLRDNEGEPASYEINKASTKISQIKRGNKGIQITDLPIFADLLEVSVDSILSGGTAPSPSFSRMTNYSIAFSKDEEEWEEYVNHPDKPFLNPDEYGKTVIDYALEFKNYDFLKYLMEKGYIWFVREDPNLYWRSFGAGTSIKKRTWVNNDALGGKMLENDQLRTSLVALALEKGDAAILDGMKAREVPELYGVSCFYDREVDFERYYNPEYMDRLAECDEAILRYFSEEFEINTGRDDLITVTFPYLGKLIGLAMKKHNKKVPILLENALQHNRNVLKRIKEVAEIYSDAFEGMREYMGADRVEAEIMSDFHFHEESGTVCFHSALFGQKKEGLFSNVIKVTANSKDEKINALIEKVNAAYDQIANYHYEEEEK